jgi:outer membrane murein-binding lipoprotein Lpp
MASALRPTVARPRLRWARASVPITLLTLGLVGGCAGESDALKARVKALSDEVLRLQNQHDRMEERLAAMESDRSAPTPTAPEASAGTPSERPPLRVVKLEPGQAASAPPVPGEAPEPPEDPSRPVIKVDGSARGGKRAFEGVRPAQPDAGAKQ